MFDMIDFDSDEYKHLSDAEKWRARQAAALLEASRENDPQAFVERSQDPYSPTHHLFNWDTGDEAQELRLRTAKQIILKVQEHAPRPGEDLS